LAIFTRISDPIPITTLGKSGHMHCFGKLCAFSDLLKLQYVTCVSRRLGSRDRLVVEMDGYVGTWVVRYMGSWVGWWEMVDKWIGI
jgi:hypothetical protein